MSRRITPEAIFFDRRRFLETLGLGLAAAVSSSCSRDARSSEGMLSPPIDRSEVFPAARNRACDLPSMTPREKAAAHGNFSEFLPGRGGPGETFPTPIFNGYTEEVGALYPDEPRAPLPPLRAGETAR